MTTKLSSKKCLFQLEKLFELQDWKLKRLGRWLTKHLSHAIEHLPDKEGSIFKVFKHLLATILLIKKSKLFKNKILSMLESLPKSKWTTFLDNLNSSNNLNTLHIQLLQILLQESISREKAYQPFWTPAYKTVSETLLLPIGTDYVGLDLTSSTCWSQRQVEESSFLKILTTKHQSKSSQKTLCPSFMSSLADKWEKKAMPTVSQKTLRIKIYPTTKQKLVIDEYINTSRFVYNRTLEYIKKGHKPNFFDLRDKLVTQNTKKGMDEYKAFDPLIKELKQQQKKSEDKEEIKQIKDRIKDLQQQRRDEMKAFDAVSNSLIHQFELNTPKDIRACAVKRCCDAMKTGFTNLMNGNIKHFNLKYKKKTDKLQTIELTPKLISVQDGEIKIPSLGKKDCLLKTHKPVNVNITQNVDIVRNRNEYWVHLCVPVDIKPSSSPLKTVAGVDLGIRTFGTVHSHNTECDQITEYKHRDDLLKKLNMKIKLLKSLKRRIRKKHITKLEKKKTDIVDCLHWEFINHLLKHNDVVYLGDIKSHDIVKGSKIKYLNIAFNDLKFYLLKQRLLYKAFVLGKKVFMVPEPYTSKTCSCCGALNDKLGSKEVFECDCCKLVTGRDMNASKNMMMKGMFL